jgi:hypothetical protein
MEWQKRCVFAFITAVFRLFKPSFHPKHHDTNALLAQWSKILFAPDGMLYEPTQKQSRGGCALTVRLRSLTIV